MARIKIKDLPIDMKISREEMKRITGGYDLSNLEISEALSEAMEEMAAAKVDRGGALVSDAKEQLAAAQTVISEMTEIEEKNITKVLG